MDGLVSDGKKQKELTLELRRPYNPNTRNKGPDQHEVVKLRLGKEVPT